MNCEVDIMYPEKFEGTFELYRDEVTRTYTNLVGTEGEVRGIRAQLSKGGS